MCFSFFAGRKWIVITFRFIQERFECFKPDRYGDQKETWHHVSSHPAAPQNTAPYLFRNRLGRHGRAGNSLHAHTFVSLDALSCPHALLHASFHAKIASLCHFFSLRKQFLAIATHLSSLPADLFCPSTWYYALLWMMISCSLMDDDIMLSYG